MNERSKVVVVVVLLLLQTARNETKNKKPRSARRAQAPSVNSSFRAETRLEIHTRPRYKRLGFGL